MAEQRLLFIDIEPKSNSSARVDGRAEKPLWSRSDNAFRFNFLSDNSPAPQEETSPSDGTEAAEASRISFTGQSSAFAFNFQIPPATPAENMETTETPDTSSPGSQQCVQEEKPSPLQDVNSPPVPSVQSKAKKKKKSGKKKPSDNTEQKPGSAEGSQGGEETELSAEEQLNRQLDWCIEHLELGMRSQKGTPKQKEEASRALKTLRSSKAPLAKKKQVIRAMTLDITGKKWKRRRASSTNSFRAKLHQRRSKLCQILQRSVFSTGELKSSPRHQPQRGTCSKNKPGIQTRHHRLRRRRQLLSSLHQRRSFASIFSDLYPEDTSGLSCVLDTLCDRNNKKHTKQGAALEMVGDKQSQSIFKIKC